MPETGGKFRNYLLGWAWAQRLRPASKLVLLVLCDNANHDGEVVESNARLAGQVGISERQLVRIKQALQKTGHVRVVRVHEWGSGARLADCWTLNAPCFRSLSDKMSPPPLSDKMSPRTPYRDPIGVKGGSPTLGGDPSLTPIGSL